MRSAMCALTHHPPSSGKTSDHNEKGKFSIDKEPETKPSLNNLLRTERCQQTILRLHERNEQNSGGQKQKKIQDIQVKFNDVGNAWWWASPRWHMMHLLIQR